MALKSYVPDRGDLVHLNWYPSAGNEMQDDYYGLVLSPLDFNRKTGLAMICPTTSVISRDWSFAVLLKKGTLPPRDGKAVDSALLVDQTRSMDFRVRGIKYIAACPRNILDEVTEILLAVLDPQAF